MIKLKITDKWMTKRKQILEQMGATCTHDFIYCKSETDPLDETKVINTEYKCNCDGFITIDDLEYYKDNDLQRFVIEGYLEIE
jgi:hypothetical protein